MSSCGIACADVTVLFSVLKVYSNRLEECRLASNLISEQGVHSICPYLISEHCHLVMLCSTYPEPVVQRYRGHWRPVPHEQPEAQLQTHSPHVVPERDCGLHVLRGLEGSTCPPLPMMMILSITTYRSCQSRVLTVLSFPHLQVLKKHLSLLRLDLSFQVAVSQHLARNQLLSDHRGPHQHVVPIQRQPVHAGPVRCGAKRAARQVRGGPRRCRNRASPSW